MARSIDLPDVKRGDLLRVPPQDLIVHPEKRGRHFKPTQERVEEIGTSIGTYGQEQPVPVTVTHDKKLELYAGFTRWEGIVWWNGQHPDSPIRIECVVKDRNEKEAFLANLRENRVRNNTTCIDDAHNVRRLSEQHGLTDEEICAEYGTPSKPMSPAWLEGLRSLLRLNEDHQHRVHAGELSKSNGMLLASLPPEERDATLKDAEVPPVISIASGQPVAEGGGKITGTTLLAAARKRKLLTGPQSLKMPEVKSSFVYLVKEDKNPKVQKLAQAFLDFQANKLPEPDFYMALHRLLG